MIPIFIVFAIVGVSCSPTNLPKSSPSITKPRNASSAANTTEPISKDPESQIVIVKHVILPGGCNFDADLCQWRNVKGDDFDWERHSGRTTSTETGPESDVSGTGHYMLIEASWPRRVGHVARLFSPPMRGVRCMRFYYNMYGTGIGDLKVYIIEGRTPHFAWGRYRNQGSRWHSAQVTVYGNKEYKVAFFARRGKSYQSDMALDNIQFLNGTCDGKPLTEDQKTRVLEAALTRTRGEPGTCDFDGGFCEWVNVLFDDNFDWLLNSGATATGDTGPLTDHTGQNGKYIFIEASMPRLPGHKAQLLSPRLCGRMCMQFYYNMYGNQVGEIIVYKKIGLGGDDRLWSMAGEQGTNWKEALINIDGRCYQIVIEGIIGNGYLGDVAIDDIVFTKGNCCKKKYRNFDLKSAGNCSFDNGFCNWTNHKWDDFNWTLEDGATSSNKTGPNKPFNGKGQYAYVEASEPRLPGDKAILVGPVLRGQVCMRFKYHMYGEYTGSLTIFKHGTGVPRTQIWKRKGNRGNLWRDGYINLKCEGPFFQIEFEAVINGWRSDIAIDEITFDTNMCAKVKDAKIPEAPKTAATPFHVSSGNCTFPGTFCDWKNARFDDIDWEIGSGRTPTHGTGPNGDVDGNGKYIFIEASMYQTRRYRKRARLVSGLITGSKCMRFHYHMSGRGTGVLVVQKIDVKTKRITRLWYRNGNQGEHWIRGFLNFGGEGYKVAFIGSTAGSPTGDIALDDISFIPGKCTFLLEAVLRYKPPKIDFVPKASNKDLPENCTFEEGNMCKWENDPSDKFNWLMKRGKTPSRFTGPSSGHGGKGAYIYIEVSPPIRHQDRARLVLVTSGSSRCLRFFYFMYGKDTGQLNVYQQLGSGQNPGLHLKWRRIGEQGKRWLPAHVDIMAGGSYKIIIEGVCGPGFKGDTAVDDIVLTNGPC